MARRMTQLIAAALALSVVFAGGAAASHMTGEQLLKLCTANMDGRGNPMAAAECMGFVVGVADTFDCVEDSHGLKWDPTVAVSQPQLVRLVVRRIQSDPTALKGDGHMAVAQALSGRFPCADKTAGN